MDVRTSRLAKQVEAKYGKPELGKTYKIDGKTYMLTDGNLKAESLSKKALELIEKINNNL